MRCNLHRGRPRTAACGITNREADRPGNRSGFRQGSCDRDHSRLPVFADRRLSRAHTSDRSRGRPVPQNLNLEIIATAGCSPVIAVNHRVGDIGFLCAAVGVPEIVRVAASNDRPAGRAETYVLSVATTLSFRQFQSINRLANHVTLRP